MTDVVIVVPVLNEAAALPRLIRLLRTLEPPPAEILVVDGGSTDESVRIAREAGLRVVEHGARGRAAQINRGVAAASAPLVCILHADTNLPDQHR